MRCIFSGEETNSDEHVVPRWLQKRFSLADQTVVIPNGTTLKYKHLKVPASKKHNGRFGEIENRISEGKFDLGEIYLWALKIHIGFIFRDSTLRFDIKNPAAPFILDIGNFESEVNLFRMLYAHWGRGGTTDPKPFGSVYILDSLLPAGNFDLFHCLITGTIGIHIGGKFIVVFLWDQSDGMHVDLMGHWTNHHLPFAQSTEGRSDPEMYGYMAHHVWACEAAYWLYRNRRSFNFVSTEQQLLLVPPMMRRPTRPPQEQEFKMVCRSFGLDLVEFNEDAVCRYAPLSLPEA